METKADVKAIMARFQTSGGSVDQSSSPEPNKQPLYPTLSSGPAIPPKKPVFESLSGSAISSPAKPSYLKNTMSTKSDTEVHEATWTPALTPRFSNNKEETKLSSKPSAAIKPAPPLKAPDAKPPVQKPPLYKPPIGSTLSDTKPLLPKHAPVLGPKPSWVREDPGSSPSPPKLPPLQQKPSSSLSKLKQHETEGAKGDTTGKTPPQPSATSKPTSSFLAAQSIFSKDRTEQTDSKDTTDGRDKLPPVKLSLSKKPSFKADLGDSSPTSRVNTDDMSGPKRNQLPNSLALGPPPAKPNRPPRVNLESFRRGSFVTNGLTSTLKKAINPLSSATHHGNQSNPQTPTQPLQTALPTLPPRHLRATIQSDDCYDDVDEPSNAPPPPPLPATGHPSWKAKEQPHDDEDEDDDDDSDGEMYEELDDRWDGQTVNKMKPKGAKHVKKQLEAERKEQRERERKEQDARKKFKLVGPLEMLHQGTACVDCRGGKADLALKQGDPVDIIRVHGNPEGKWLGRTQDGSIGYVKTTAVETDINALKDCQAQQQSYDPEVYDDIDVTPSHNSGIRGPGVVLPPPLGDGGEIYDDVVDPNLEISPERPETSTRKLSVFMKMFDRTRRLPSTTLVPPPSQFTADRNSDHQAAIDEEVYDDVDAQEAPLPPPLSSLLTLKGRNKVDDKDLKKQKKFEKEQREFRRKFKFEGEIQVMYQVTIKPTLISKKWGAKDLSVKAGEKLDVIAKAEDNKLICRNEEGKYGYVSINHTVTDDGEIYDDIGDGCIYDND